MRKLLIAIVSSTLLCTALPSMAQSLPGDMHVLAGGMKAVQATNDKAEMVSTLTDMRAAAEDAKTHTPDTLAGKANDSTEVQAYHAQLDKLIAQIDATLKQANTGDLAAAKEEAKKLAAIRNEGHKNFR